MAVSRRELIAYGTAGALTALATGRNTIAEGPLQDSSAPSPMPAQVASDRVPNLSASRNSSYDIRNDLKPRRLTMAMWDQAYVMRHMPGGSYENYDRVLDETVERGYNTVRIDPMPQFIDLRKPDRELRWADPRQPFMPWGANKAVNGPAGLWIIDFIEKLHKRSSLYYTLSGWWSMPGPPGSPRVPELLRKPTNMMEGAEIWATLLTDWKKRFGFDRIVYVDVANEMPYFFPEFVDRLKKATGVGFDDLSSLSAAQISFLADEINKAMGLLRRDFPE
ncbi:MAG: hypothetical protein QOJ51_3571, partial [Acidobacteriaceae bacterium]|nr:hypothetical protein [Acidobacteriaceae bacterium]